MSNTGLLGSESHDIPSSSPLPCYNRWLPACFLGNPSLLHLQSSLFTSFRLEAIRSSNTHTRPVLLLVVSIPMITLGPPKCLRVLIWSPNIALTQGTSHSHPKGPQVRYPHIGFIAKCPDLVMAHLPTQDTLSGTRKSASTLLPPPGHLFVQPSNEFTHPTSQSF
jgi:hypothetical protein